MIFRPKEQKRIAPGIKWQGGLALEPAVLRNARRLHSQVERADTVTIFWVRRPSTTLRGAVQACLPGA
jgi:hypothetical protein